MARLGRVLINHGDVRFATAAAVLPGVVISDTCLAALFDHLVGTDQHRFRNGNTERFGGLQVHDDIENRGLFDRQVARAAPLRSLSTKCAARR